MDGVYNRTKKAMKRINVDQGSALLSVILLLATITLLVTEMTERQFLDIRRTGNLLAQDQAYLYAQAAEDLAIRVLKEDVSIAIDQKKPQVDHLKEEWRQQVTFPLEGGMISARLTDLQGLFNINDLHSDRWQARDRFLRLLKGLDLSTLSNTGVGTVDPDELLLSIIEWMDDDDQSQTGGAEELYYLGLPKPYRTANQLIRSISELRMIKGFTPELIDLLRPFVVALPEGLPLNVNTANIEVLTSYPGVSQVQSIIDGRITVNFEHRGKVVFRGDDPPLEFVSPDHA